MSPTNKQKTIEVASIVFAALVVALLLSFALFAVMGESLDF